LVPATHPEEQRDKILRESLYSRSILTVMKPILILVFLPVLIGVVANTLFRGNQERDVRRDDRRAGRGVFLPLDP